ncbi:MAG: trypsin-like peptidase domain-containing protein [Thermoflavifilum sp.]|uniref:trypsin-like peptidase domain-containing protein n=1 Tax=Thermoflavifilum sp. TaxID=1968839 RepID=UPI0018A43C5D|nr:trypsin-like peptidase domain-containing protein [Thermoflavifilum sp.]QOR75520.1 MAG: trypsin-like peptidase domain-containing protein [Thermoflavifilum sp.]
MDMRSEWMDRIHRYLQGEMDAAEEAEFIRLCEEDAQLRRWMEEERQFIHALKAGLHRQWIKESFASQPQTRLRLHPGSSFIRTGKEWLAHIAVAATVALLVSLVAFWSFNQWYIRPNKMGYVDLRRAIDNIQRSQYALMNDMHHNGRLPANPGTYGGSGFLISDNGYLVTNYHVIRNADSIYVQDNKGNAYKARMVFQDPATDLAVLKIIDSNFCMNGALPYTLSASEAPLGEQVFTLGYPKDEIVYGEGYISSETGYRDDSTAYQLSIPVNPGNSGGPLFDSKGRIIGIISGKQGESDRIAFAIKATYLKAILDSLPNDFNKRAILRTRVTKNTSHPDLHNNRVALLKQLKDYVMMVKVYN